MCTLVICYIKPQHFCYVQLYVLIHRRSNRSKKIHTHIHLASWKLYYTVCRGTFRSTEQVRNPQLSLHPWIFQEPCVCVKFRVSGSRPLWQVIFGTIWWKSLTPQLNVIYNAVITGKHTSSPKVQPTLCPNAKQTHSSQEALSAIKIECVPVQTQPFTEPY